MMAVDTEYRKAYLPDDDSGTWSVRQLKDAAGVARDEKVSQLAWLRGEADVVDAGDGYIALAVPGWIPTGETPRKLKITGKEILIDE